MTTHRSSWTLMTTLVKREFIEHRLLLLYTPLLCVLACTLWFAISLANSNLTEADLLRISGVRLREGFNLTAEIRAEIIDGAGRWRYVTNMINTFEKLMRLALWSSLAFYYLMTLYQQRNDRSILFWNSLPVRDSQTILSKLLTGLVLCHALYLLGIAALELLMPAVVWVYSRFLEVGAWDRYLSRVFDAQPTANGDVAVVWFVARDLLTQMPIDILWTLPVYGWLLLASAWSPRAPLMWALGPWLFIIGIELAIYDETLILDAALAHTFPVNMTPVIPARIQSQLIPGALLGALFVFGAIWFNRPMRAGLGFDAVLALLRAPQVQKPG